jgi:hypothetical protein
MEIEMGFLPHPKYDETQKNYITDVFSPTLMAVPVTAEDLERTGIILEDLCFESHKKVIPAYYDKMRKTKIARDDESGEMLDIMFPTRRADLAQIYWESMITVPFFQVIGRKKAVNAASFIEKNKNKIENEIAKAIAVFVDVD